MKCKEFRDLISAAVDQYLTGSEKDSFDEHAQACPPCRSEYELERSTKLVVHNRAHMVSVPPSVRTMLLRRLDREAAGAGRAVPAWVAILRKPVIAPAVAFAAAAVVVALLVGAPDRPQDSPTAISASVIPTDVINQSVSNYHALLRGDIKPAMMSSDPEELNGFFTGKTAFPVRVPSMRECTLVGGVVNEQGGTTLAHMVYRNREKIIYMAQTCWETVQKGENLRLASDATRELLQTGWYSGNGPDSDAVILWTTGRTLCVAVAHMEKDRLMSYLQTAEGSASRRW